VVIAQVDGYLTMVLRANCSAISHVDNVDIIIISHDQVGTAARLAVLHFLRGLKLGIALLDIVAVSQLAALVNCIVYIMREIWL